MVDTQIVILSLASVFMFCLLRCYCKLLCIDAGYDHEDEPELTKVEQYRRKKCVLLNVKSGKITLAEEGQLRAVTNDPTDSDNCDCSVPQSVLEAGMMHVLNEKCSICFDEYKDGNEVIWSANEKCNHVYHRNCILSWLMNHNTCPECREAFVNVA